MEIEIGDKKYKVQIARTEEEKEKGLQGVTSLPEDEGMLFIYDEPQTVGFWMDSTEIPLDIIFINNDEEVISIYQGEPNSRTIAEEDNVKYVLEVNQGSGIKPGDELDFDEEDDEDEEYTMSVIGPDGQPQYFLKGGERIVSRRETKVLIRKAKKASKNKGNDKYNNCCKSLGKYIFKVLDKQDDRPAEYVDQPN